MNNGADTVQSFSWKELLKVRVIALAGWLLVWLIGSTLRFRVEGYEHYGRIRAQNLPVIFSFWHNQIFLMTYFWKFRNIVVITSRHFDGEYIARIIRAFGYGAARGSSTRGAAGALLQLKTHLKQGLDVAFTIDGPRGPIFRVKPGPVWLAQKTGHPLLCLHAEPGKFWTLKSWDSFRIPRPFSEVFMVLGEPLYLDENVTPETGLEMYQKKMDELKSICEPSD